MKTSVLTRNMARVFARFAARRAPRRVLGLQLGHQRVGERRQPLLAVEYDELRARTLTLGLSCVFASSSAEHFGTMKVTSSRHHGSFAILADSSGIGVGRATNSLYKSSPHSRSPQSRDL